jgi:hypothetical protein
MSSIVIDYYATHMVCNDKIIICVEFDNDETDYDETVDDEKDDDTNACDDNDDGKFHYYDMNLELVIGKISKKDEAEIGEICNMRLNDNNLFVLCDNNEQFAANKLLMIFDLETFDLVKEIDVAADQMKLVSTGHLFLYNPRVNMLFLYNQSGDFEELGKVQLDCFTENDNDLPLTMNEDASTTISFYNYSRVKYISFGHLFKIDSI